MERPLKRPPGGSHSHRYNVTDNHYNVTDNHYNVTDNHYPVTYRVT